MLTNYKRKASQSLYFISAITLGVLLNGCKKDIPTQVSTNEPTAPTANVQAPVQVVDNAHSDIRVALQDNLHKSGVNATVISVIPTAMPELFLAQVQGMPPIFTDKTGTYVLQGDLLQLGDTAPVNLSASALATMAKETLSAIDPSEMIIFPATGDKKATVYAFSDPTCHYCQLLQEDMPKLNALGIEVRYLAWPRSADTIPLAETIWCSADRQQALIDAKKDKKLTPISCDNPVKKHITIGEELGVSGTPAVFTENGQQIGGYLPPDELAKQAIANQQ